VPHNTDPTPVSCPEDSLFEILTAAAAREEILIEELTNAVDANDRSAVFNISKKIASLRRSNRELT